MMQRPDGRWSDQGPRIVSGATRVALLVALVVLVGCAEDAPEPLLDIDYSGWRQTTSAMLNFPVPGHGSTRRVIFCNDAAWQAEPADDFSITYQEGAVFIKEIYPLDSPEGTEPERLLAMIKDSDAPIGRGGWIWVARTVATGEETIFDEEYCVTCHANANETHPYGVGNDNERFRDYVFHSPAFEARGLPDR